MPGALILNAGREPAAGVALHLARAGWKLFLTDLSPLTLDRTLADAQAAGAEVKGEVTDPSRGLPAGVLFQDACAFLGTPDLLVLSPSARPRTRFLDLDEWDFQRTFEANVSSQYLLLRLFGRHLAEYLRDGRAALLLPETERDAEGVQATLRMTAAAAEELLRSAAPALAETGLKVFTCRLPRSGVPGDPALLLRWLSGTEPFLPGAVLDLSDQANTGN